MKLNKILFLIPAACLLFSCGSNGVSASDSHVDSDTSSSGKIVEDFDISIPISFDVNKASQRISPFIYGTFIEHIETCIYDGIWSEMIKDRKFHDPVATGTSQWIREGDVTNETELYKSAPNATRLNQNSYISQSGLGFVENKEYSGYVWAAGSGILSIEFTNSEETIKKEIMINSTSMRKYEFFVVSNSTSNKTKIKFLSKADGIIIDSMSLMPADNYYGMRKDTLDLLKNLNAPFYRWPGGNFVSGYNWEDGIGDRDERVSKRNLNYCGLESDFETYEEMLANDLMKIGNLGFYGAFEPNDYGIDEFIMMCRYLDAEPNIVVNSGFGTSTQAANEVSYCNSKYSEYASKRQQEEPYNVTYFSIGNEMNGDWQLGHVGINEYIRRHNEFYDAMKNVDRNIKIIGVGDNWSDWSQKMLQGTEMDYISEHFYGARDETDTKNHILSLKKQAETRISKHRQLNPRNEVFMAIDEYAYENAELPSRLKDGMGVALALNTFIKNSDTVKIACYSSTVNATQGSLTTDKTKAYMQGNGYALMLYRNNLQNTYLISSYQASKVKDGVFEIIATISEDKHTVSLGVVNSSYSKIELTSDVFKNVISKQFVTSESVEDYDKKDSLKFVYGEKSNVKNAVVEPCSITTITVSI